MSTHADPGCGCDCHEPAHAPSQGWRPCRWRPLTWGDLPLLLAAFQVPLDEKTAEILDAIQASDRALSRKFNRLERKMSALEDVLADLDTATNEVAAKIDAQTAQIADLAAQLAAALPGSAEAAALQAQIDAAVTAIGTESARLHGLAADPANPVPVA